jgi:hypothetical protein
MPALHISICYSLGPKNYFVCNIIHTIDQRKGACGEGVIRLMAMTSHQTGGVSHTCAKHSWPSSKVTLLETLWQYARFAQVQRVVWRHEAHYGFSRRCKYRSATSNSLRISGTCCLVIFHGVVHLVASGCGVLRQAMLGWLILSFCIRTTWIWRQTIYPRLAITVLYPRSKEACYNRDQSEVRHMDTCFHRR